MSRSFPVALILFFLGASATPHAQDLMLRNVNVVDIERGEVDRGRAVTIAGGRIRLTGPSGSVATPAGARIIDCESGFLMPALWDMHIHPWSIDDLTLLVANGVGGARIMAGKPEHLAWRARTELGELLGPRLLIAGPIVEGLPPPEQAKVVDTADRRLLATADEGTAEVRKQKAAGFDYIKVYNNLPRDAYRAIAAEAKRQGMAVVGHVPFQVKLRGALDAHQASIEHLRGYVERLVPADAPVQPGVDLRSRTLAWEYVDATRFPALVRETLAAGAWQCPTLSTRIYESPADVVENYLALPEAQYLTRGAVGMLRNRQKVKWLSNFTTEDFQHALRGDQREDAFLRSLQAAGVPLLAGTDIGPLGFSLHGELERLVAAGLTPREALQAATINPVRFARLDNQLGRVQANYEADLVLLEANPLEDIRNSRRIRAVVIRGRLIERAELDEMLSKARERIMREPAKESS